MESDAQEGDEPKFFFGAIPPRAIADPNLKARHFRVLAAISLHDRMSVTRGGQGCWASVKSMAKRWGINYSNFSTTLNELVEWGYVLRQKRTADKRTMVLRIAYLLADNRLCFGEDGAADASPRRQSTLENPNGRSNGRSFATVTNYPDEIVCQNPKVVCPFPKITQQDQGDTAHNKDPRTNLTKRSSINSPKGALRADWFEGIVTNPERVFNEIYVCLKRGDAVTEEFMTALGMIASLENGKPLGSRASRELEYCRKRAA